MQWPTYEQWDTRRLADHQDSQGTAADEVGFHQISATDHFFQIHDQRPARSPDAGGTILDVLSSGRAWLGIGARWVERMMRSEANPCTPKGRCGSSGNQSVNDQTGTYEPNTATRLECDPGIS